MAEKQALPTVEERKKLTKQVLTEGLRSQIKFERTWIDVMADFFTAAFGTVTFLVLNAFIFIGWILWNTPGFGFPLFDPFPYELLTTIVSLEAIFLSIIVLISQNRQSKITDIRQKVNFEVDVRAEEEVTEILKLLSELHAHAGLKTTGARELARMKQATNIGEIQRDVEKEEPN
jgi:uncharacterized membrane protein